MQNRQPIKVKDRVPCKCGCGQIVKLWKTTDKRFFNSECEKRYEAANPKTSNAKEICTREKIASELKPELENQINGIIRLIDKGHLCICRQKPMKIATAGHLWSVGSNETLRFHLLNIWAQDYDSNGASGGEPVEFKAGLISLYGPEFFTRLESLKSHPPIKLTAPEIKEKISICRGIQKWLKLQDRKFTLSERVELRQEFNKKIGIYEI